MLATSSFDDDGPRRRQPQPTILRDHHVMGTAAYLTAHRPRPTEARAPLELQPLKRVSRPPLPQTRLTRKLSFCPWHLPIAPPFPPLQPVHPIPLATLKVSLRNPTARRDIESQWIANLCIRLTSMSRASAIMAIHVCSFARSSRPSSLIFGSTITLSTGRDHHPGSSP